MNAWQRLDRLRLLALLLWALPVIALLPLGLLWLWRSGAMFGWLAALLVCSAGGYGLQYWLLRRNRQILPENLTTPDPYWSPHAENAWDSVEQWAEQVQPEQWPLDDGGRLWQLGKETLRLVAHHYHPEEARPLLELTIPHTLLIIERASHDLRATVTDHLPLSHRLTVGDLLRAWRWKDAAQRLLNVYRAGRVVVNPLDALLSEAWGHLRSQAYGEAWGEVQRWLLREYVRKVGYYSIELYSGHLTLTEPSAPRHRSESTAPSDPSIEPLHIVILGRSNVGKSSLINAMFGKLTAASDVLPDTTPRITHYRLERQGLTAALISDMPGCDSSALSEKNLHKAALQADLLIWVCAAQRPDRQLERAQLDNLRELFSARIQQQPPPLLVAVTHIDQLSPSREWQPPYALDEPQGTKALNIRGALEAVATDLAVAVATVIPVCLADGRIYNVDDVLWAAILEQQSAADKVRFLRCKAQQRHTENWDLLYRQLANAGRWLVSLPKRS